MDEAERCHYLAILDLGIKKADDTPQKLMEGMHANVVEITGPGLRRVKQELLQVEHIPSVAQLGAHLRVLVSKDVSDPLEWVRTRGKLAPADYELELVRPSLEDVFVVATGAKSHGVS